MDLDRSFPTYRSEMEYVCQGCGARYSGDDLHYTCPDCKGVFLLEDRHQESLGRVSGQVWRETFDARKMSVHPALQGIFRYYELMAPMLEPEDIVWLGEGHTPVVLSGSELRSRIDHPLAFKNDGLNPSASFKDRGMACAFSALKAMIRRHGWDEVLTVCASTGDTSAAAAMYGAYVGAPVKTLVLLPQGRVTPQQLGQPLGSGARVFELPGVFDDCMRVVEHLAEHYRVALLNSKNSWRILGQESYAYEVAQWAQWDMSGKALFVPIGNAGNISAIMSGFLKLHELGVIESLPRVFGVQSDHADPVYRFYAQSPGQREYQPVQVQSSVAQAAMIGNPVSFPRVKALADRYEKLGGRGWFQVVQVEEQAIMDSMILANRHGHIACTQGGECLAGLIRAKELGLVARDEQAILDATAHSLKFMGFQDMYFSDSFPQEYGVTPRAELMNTPHDLEVQSMAGHTPEQIETFVRQACKAIEQHLELKPKR
jgi:threonine synthase